MGMRTSRGIEPWCKHVHRFPFFIRYWNQGKTLAQIKALMGVDKITIDSIDNHLFQAGKIEARGIAASRMNETIRVLAARVQGGHGKDQKRRNMETFRWMKEINFQERVTKKRKIKSIKRDEKSLSRTWAEVPRKKTRREPSE